MPAPTAPAAARPRRSLAGAGRSCALALALACAACRTTRVLVVTSHPPGALVRLDEEVIGRTPLDHPFMHYGRRRLTLYLPGYRTWSRRIDPRPPWYSRFPLDFVTEVLLPLGLEHRYPYDAVLVEDTGGEQRSGDAAVEAFVRRAEEMRADMREAR